MAYGLGVMDVVAAVMKICFVLWGYAILNAWVYRWVWGRPLHTKAWFLAPLLNLTGRRAPAFERER